MFLNFYVTFKINTGWDKSSKKCSFNIISAPHFEHKTQQVTFKNRKLNKIKYVNFNNVTKITLDVTQRCFQLSAKLAVGVAFIVSLNIYQVKFPLILPTLFQQLQSKVPTTSFLKALALKSRKVLRYLAYNFVGSTYFCVTKKSLHWNR